MRSGKLRDRLIIEQPVAGEPDKYGEIVDTWQKLDNAWGEVKDIRGEETVRAAEVAPDATIRVLTRYRADVTEVMRLNFGGRYLYPVALIPDVRDTSLTWYCKEER